MRKKASYGEQRTLAIVQAHVPTVTSVKDAKHDIVIETTKEDCTRRGRKMHGECVMAQACRRQLHADAAIISASRAYIVQGNKATRYVIGEGIAREIVSFDRGAGFTPGKYILQKPTRMQKIGHGYSRGFGPKKGKRRQAVVTRGLRASLRGAGQK